MINNKELEEMALLMIENKEVELAKDSKAYSYVDVICANKDLLSAMEVRVIIALSYFAREKKYCYPTREKLAEMTGYNVRYISEAVKGLEEKGFVYVRRNKDVNNRERNLYFFLSPGLQKNRIQACKKTVSRPAKKPYLGYAADVTETITEEQPQYNNSSKQDTTIDASIKAELSAPVGRQSTSNNTIELTEEQQELLDIWNDLYPNIKARKGDLKNLSELDLDDINWFQPIEWWKYFCKDTDDKLISTSDRSLTLFLKNINKVVSWKDQLPYQLQKRLDFDIQKALRNKMHEDLDIDIRTENNIPKYYWYDKVTRNIICEATESHINNILESSADCLKMDIRRNMNYNKEQFEMTERLTNRKLKGEIRREDEIKKIQDEWFTKPRDQISFDAINYEMNLQPTEEDIFWE